VLQKLDLFLSAGEWEDTTLEKDFEESSHILVKALFQQLHGIKLQSPLRISSLLVSVQTLE
jgi:hypothetical protein